MILTTGVKRGFIIEGNSRELAFVSSLPGASMRRSEGIVRMPENLASWKALRSLEFDDICDSATNKMEALKTAYRSHRRSVRNAERRFKLTGKTDIPVPLLTVPFEHQVRAFGFASSIDQCALLMEQGTGKTLVAIAVAVKRALDNQITKLLVVCPKAVKPVWPKEINKHTDYECTVSIDSPPKGPGLQVWVTNYDRLKREMRRIKKWGPDMIISDESHRIKNRKAARTKALITIGAKVTYKMVLTGTAIGKCISEAWSQYKFLNPDVFGSNYTNFKEDYLKMGGYMGYSVVGYKNYDTFTDKLHSIAFRVTKDECLDLPPVTYQRLYVEPDSKTRKLYKQMEEELYLELEDDEVTADREVTKQMKLRQMSGGSVKTDSESIAHISDCKMSTLKEYMEDRVNDKTVIFFSFTQEIKQAQKMLKGLGINTLTLSGATPDKEREVFETRFQEDKSIGAALIQVQTGAEGLTLTAANVAIFFSPSFSYISFSQAKDRINRIGQTRAMTILFIILEETMDERVVDVLESNGQLTKKTFETSRNYHLGDTKMAKAATEAKYTAKTLAEDLGITPADLRKHLRALKIEKPEGGWNWNTKKDADAIAKQVKARLADLASKPAKEPKAKAPAKKAPAKKAPAAKKTTRTRKAKTTEEAE